MKTRQPIYPRPVPDIDFDEIAPLSDTIDYSVKKEDVKVVSDLEERARKRRRIEDAANAYLRGQEIFIMSAKLKGPLNSNWRSPWKRSSLNLTNNKLTETPRATNKHMGRRKDAVDILRRREIDVGSPTIKTPSLKREEFQRRNSDQKVQAWLHQNQRVEQKRETPHQSSSPSRSHIIHVPMESKPASFKKVTPSHPISPTISLPAGHTRSDHLRSHEKPLQSHSKLQDVLKQDVKIRTGLPTRKGQISSDNDEPHSQARAELAILRMRKEKDESEVDEDETSMDTAKGSNANERQEVFANPVENILSQITPENSQHEEIHDGMTKVYNDPVQTVADHHSKSPTTTRIEGTTSDETSKGRAAHMQGVAQVFVESGDGLRMNGTTQGQMLPPATLLSEPSTAELLPSAQKQADIVMSNSHPLEEVNPIEVTASYGMKTATQGFDNEPQSQKQTNRLKNGVDITHDIESDQDNPKPSITKSIDNVDHSTDVVSRFMKVSNKPRKKQASFASNVEQLPTNRSIKDTLKVGKLTTGNEVNLQKRKMLDVQDGDENIMSQTLPSFKRPMLASFRDDLTMPKPVKSILKSSNTSSTLHPSHQRGPSSIFLANEQEQDRDGLNGNEDTQFDLDGAIDDLGSFLSTWDAEKEASQMIA